MNPSIDEQELHAYADGRLAADRDAAVRAWLDAHPDDAARVSAWQTINHELSDAYAPVLDEVVPARLAAAARAPRSRPIWRGFALAASFAALGLAAGWLARGAYAPPARTALAALPRDAAIAHAVYTPEVRHPVEVGADQEQHLVAWLSKRLGESLHVPSLAEAGFSLVGGRLLPGDESAVAQFMFERASGERLTLYVTRREHSMRETAFRFSREGRINVFYWVDDRCGYALAGELDRPVLAKLAEVVYQQLEQ